MAKTETKSKDTRTETIRVPVTKLEKLAIQKRAKQSSMTVAGFLRWASMRKFYL